MKQLARALQAFIKEQGLEPGVFPTASTLRAADRADLLNGITEHGGVFALKSATGMATTRGPGWPDIATAAEQLREVVDSISVSVGTGPECKLSMPTMAQLRSAGRSDLVYAVQKFGYAEIAGAAGLVAPRGHGRR